MGVEQCKVHEEIEMLAPILKNLKAPNELGDIQIYISVSSVVKIIPDACNSQIISHLAALVLPWQCSSSLNYVFPQYSIRKMSVFERSSFRIKARYSSDTFGSHEEPPFQGGNGEASSAPPVAVRISLRLWLPIASLVLTSGGFFVLLLYPCHLLDLLL
ncbi:hypothetical protein HAX54_019356 [Datura stramonium]|uniref:Uncharacterized protein n=1 Tax=Datura stramonium TaxID=4076 RepID=A0ABS8UR91_DATST|nr:hypothetical protein [Datura stramonium]